MLVMRAGRQRRGRRLFGCSWGTRIPTRTPQHRLWTPNCFAYHTGAAHTTNNNIIIFTTTQPLLFTTHTEPINFHSISPYRYIGYVFTTKFTYSWLIIHICVQVGRNHTPLQRLSSDKITAATVTAFANLLWHRYYFINKKSSPFY